MASQNSISSQIASSNRPAENEVSRLHELLAQKEAEMASYRRRNQTLSKAINIGYWVWDEVLKKPLHMSPEMAAMFGMSPEQFQQTYQCEEDLFPYIHPDDLDYYIENLGTADELARCSNQVNAFDYRIIRPDGELRYLRELEYDWEIENGEVLRSHGAVQDLTGHHKSLEAYQRSEQRFDSLFSKLPLGVMQQDWSKIKIAIDRLSSEGVSNLKTYFENRPDKVFELVDMITVSSVNDALLEIYGTESVEKFIADEENVTHWWDESWASLYISDLVTLSGPNKLSWMEFTEMRADGVSFEARMITSIVNGDEDSWKRVLIIVEDVSERKKNEYELIESREAAEKASSAKSDFLATMSHEIRTPMNGILGMTELLMDSDIDEQSRQLASTAHRSAESLLDIINDILDFSKIEANRMELYEEDFNLCQLLEDVIEIFSTQAQSKGLECISSLSDDLPEFVNGDGLRLRQVLINLLANAVRFTETGGVRLKAVVKASAADTDQIQIEVSDTGPGIPEKLQECIFEAFTQVDSGTSRRFGGTGLGLAITRRLVELMRGNIELESSPGAGTLFRFDIPFGKASDKSLSDHASNKPEAEKSAPAVKNQFSNKILLAEDNPINQVVATNMLKVLGCVVDIANNGTEALTAVQNNTYDLVFMDCHMPEMDGFQATREIRVYEQLHGLAGLPVIALTADVKKGIENECRQAGMDDYLSKPFGQAQLETLLLQWLEPVRSPDEQPASADSTVDNFKLAELKSISQALGSDILTAAIKSFLEHAPKDVISLKRAGQDGDFEKITGIAHGLKSSSANLGATRISAICQQLEDLSREGTDQPLAGLIKTLEQLMPSIVAELRQVAGAEALEPEQLIAAVETVNCGQSATILIVDDDEAFRLITCEALKALGYHTAEASNGEEALQLLAQSPPDLVLLDAMMPKTDGFAVCRQVRNRLNIDTMPIVMLTGLGDMQSVNRAFESGATDFVMKPVNYAVLSSRIRFQLRTAENSRELKLGREQLASVQRVAGIGYWQWEVQSDRITISENLSDLLSLDEVIDLVSLEDFIQYIHPDDQKIVRDKIISASLGNRSESYEYRLLNSRSEAIIVHQELTYATSSGVVLGTIQNVTQQRESEKRIRQLAYTDTLTGLASRAYFHQRLEDLIKISQRHAQQFALMFIDLDGFKAVNDTLGHEAGDVLLREIALRLLAVVRDADFVARISGDEFCILVDNISEQYSAAYVADRCLQDINQPVVLEGQNLRPRCSIGIAHFPVDGEDSRSLLKAADSAMYAAKESGKHCYVYYQPEFTEKAEIRLRKEQELRQVIDKGQLELLYQPQVDLGTGRMVGVEVLPVWRHPVQGIIPQAEFLEIAERTGFVKPLTEWVLNNACCQAMKWKQAGLPDLRIAINISSVYFWDTEFVDVVRKALTESGLSPDTLELEITESVTQTSKNNLRIFNRLNKLGVRVAIESYGSGFSSLSTLKQLPINCLKIDSLFIRDILVDTRSSILLGTVVGAAHALGHIVIAEGVDNEDQLKVLAVIGCDLVQGSHIVKPVVGQSIPALINTDFTLKTRQQDSLLPPSQDML